MSDTMRHQLAKHTTSLYIAEIRIYFILEHHETDKRCCSDICTTTHTAARYVIAVDVLSRSIDGNRMRARRKQTPQARATTVTRCMIESQPEACCSTVAVAVLSHPIPHVRYLHDV